MPARLPDQVLIWILCLAPLAIAIASFWKLIGVVRGEALMARLQANHMGVEEAIDEVRTLRRKHGRFEFHGLLALCNALFFIWVFASDSRNLAADLRGLIPDKAESPLGDLWLGLAVFLTLAIPIVEFFWWRQLRALPDPEDPVGSRLPPMREAAGVIWWSLVGAMPFMLDPQPRLWKFWYVVACVFGASFTLPLIAYMKRRARFFKLSPTSADFDLIQRTAQEVGCRVKATEVEADERAYAYVGLFGKLVMSHGFAERFSASDKRTILAYEMFRARRDDLGIIMVATGLTLAPVLFAATLGSIGVILVLTMVLLDIFVLLPRLELRRMRRARELSANWNQSDVSVLDAYLSHVPVRPWLPTP